MNDLADILIRNQGAILTPELVAGILQSYEIAQHQGADASLPVRAPADPKQSGPYLVVDDKERVAEWVAQRIGATGTWSAYNAIGQEDAQGALVAGMLLTGMVDTNAFMHVAIADKARLHRGMVYACFDYAFNQLDLERVTGMVDSTNEAALRFDLHLGFEHEFTIPMGSAPDIVQLVMWRDRCRWIRRH